MTNLKTTKRALLSSVVALLVCFTMLLGTTFAWFTDSVTSSGNIIQTGTLEIGMYWMEGDEDPETAKWEDASEGAIFNNTKWEPGYVEAKHIKIANEGTLALKYKLLIVPNGEVEALADVIDVYYVEGAKQVTRDTLPETAVLVGTLRDMIDDPDGAIHGALLPEGETATDTYERVGEVTATIAFKMQETAGNEYKGMSIGTDFSIQLLATQYTFEEDSFDKQYDKDALYPVATAEELVAAIGEGKSVSLMDNITLDTPINYENTTATIDLNGNDLAANICAGSGAEITIKNDGIDSSSLMIDDEHSLGVVGGTLTVENVDISVGECRENVPLGVISGTLNFNNTTLLLEDWSSVIVLTDPFNSGAKCVFNMNGGEIISKANNVFSCINKTNCEINLNNGKITYEKDSINTSDYVVQVSLSTGYALDITISEDFIFETGNAYLCEVSSNQTVRVNGNTINGYFKYN